MSSAPTPTSTRHEYRVTWRRTGWRRTTADKSRTFGRRFDCDRFVRKLRDDGRRNLSDLELVKVDRRPVGGWEADPTLSAGWRR